MLNGRVAETNFEDLGGKTEVTTTFDAENQNSIEMQREVASHNPQFQKICGRKLGFNS